MNGLLAMFGCSSGWLTELDWEQIESFSLEEAGELAALDEIPDGFSGDMAALEAFGRRLYCDDHLSDPVDGAERVSCDSCHSLTRGLSDRSGAPVSPTADGQRMTDRNSIALLDTAYRQQWGWFGQYDTLRAQIGFPLTGNPAKNKGGVYFPADIRGQDAEMRIALHLVADHNSELTALFGEGVNPYDAALFALEAFVRTLVSEPSALDTAIAERTTFGHLSDAEVRGLLLFANTAGCARCHSGPFFSDGLYHNTAVFDEKLDGGRGGAGCTEDNPDCGAFQTSTLRGIADSAPYFHTGAADQWEMIKHYIQGGDERGEFAGSPDIHMGPLSLTDADADDLFAFLDTLTPPPFDPCTPTHPQ